jgi:hypothetical protein
MMPPATSTGYGNLYGNLLDHVISAALIFNNLTIAGIFRSRKRRRKGVDDTGIRLYNGAHSVHHRRRRDLIVLFIYQTAKTWTGLIIVLTVPPAYFIRKDLRRGYVRGRINLRRSQAKPEY